jgi:hypothetical protein
MSSGKNKPIYDKEGIFKIKGFRGRKFELKKGTWEGHILRDKTRWHLKGQFDKVIQTLKRPDYILRSPKEHNVASYVKKFDEYRIWGTITTKAYLYVLVDFKSNKIRTVYDNPKLKNWERIWQKK